MAHRFSDAWFVVAEVDVGQSVDHHLVGGGVAAQAATASCLSSIHADLASSSSLHVPLLRSATVDVVCEDKSRGLEVGFAPGLFFFLLLIV